MVKRYECSICHGTMIQVAVKEPKVICFNCVGKQKALLNEPKVNVYPLFFESSIQITTQKYGDGKQRKLFKINIPLRIIEQYEGNINLNKKHMVKIWIIDNDKKSKKEVKS